MPLPRALTLVATACAVACSAPAPASAESVVRYRVTFDGRAEHHRVVDHTRNGSHYHRETDVRFTFRSWADDLEFVDGQPGPAREVTQTEFDLQRHADTGYIHHPEGSSTGECVAGDWFGDRHGVALVSDLRGDRGGWAGRMSPFAVFGGDQECRGMLGGQSTVGYWADASIVVDFDVPRESVGSPGFVLPVAGGVACPSPPDTVSCSSTYAGTITFERTAQFERGTQAPQPGGPTPPGSAPPAPPAPPAPGPGRGGRPTDEEQRRIARQISAVFVRETSAGRVTATCARACDGRISAYAVAVRGQRGQAPAPKLVGRGTLRSGARGGRASGTVRFSRGAQKAVRDRGAVQFRVSVRPRDGAGPAQRRTVTVRVR